MGSQSRTQLSDRTAGEVRAEGPEKSEFSSSTRQSGEGGEGAPGPIHVCVDSRSRRRRDERFATLGLLLCL